MGTVHHLVSFPKKIYFRHIIVGYLLPFDEIGVNWIKVAIQRPHTYIVLCVKLYSGREN